MKKYVCSYKNFPNCRVHDAGLTEGLMFFSTIDELKSQLASTYQDYELGDIYYAPTGTKVARVAYVFNRHEFSRIELGRTMEWLPAEDDFESDIFEDDGYAHKKWVNP